MENLCKSYCLNITVRINTIVSINFPSALSFIVNTTLKYYPKQFWNNKLKLMLIGGTMNIFPKKLSAMKYLAV